jgi:hypothetical protein
MALRNFCPFSYFFPFWLVVPTKKNLASMLLLFYNQLLNRPFPTKNHFQPKTIFNQKPFSTENRFPNIWYIFPILVCCCKKNLATLLHTYDSKSIQTHNLPSDCNAEILDI